LNLARGETRNGHTPAQTAGDPSDRRRRRAYQIRDGECGAALIDPKAVLFLIGTEMDYKTEKLSAQFVFNNPNQTSACGCGESVQLKPAAEAH
jgi:hypothetical protein